MNPAFSVTKITRGILAATSKERPTTSVKYLNIGKSIILFSNINRVNKAII